MSRRNTGFPPAVRQVIVARSAGRCERCGKYAPDAQIHHRRPRGMGGSLRVDTNTASNGLFVDPDCHRFIEMNRSSALEHGWLLRQHWEPQKTQVFYRGRWALLLDDGGVEYLEEVA